MEIEDVVFIAQLDFIWWGDTGEMPSTLFMVANVNQRMEWTGICRGLGLRPKLDPGSSSRWKRKRGSSVIGGVHLTSSGGVVSAGPKAMMVSMTFSAS